MRIVSWTLCQALGILWKLINCVGYERDFKQMRVTSLEQFWWGWEYSLDMNIVDCFYSSPTSFDTNRSFHYFVTSERNQSVKFCFMFAYVLFSSEVKFSGFQAKLLHIVYLCNFEYITHLFYASIYLQHGILIITDLWKHGSNQNRAYNELGKYQAHS